MNEDSQASYKADPKIEPENLHLESERLHLIRLHPRLELNIEAYIECAGQIHSVMAVDISAKVVRFDKRFPLSQKGKCTVTLKTKPVTQFIGTPIIEDEEVVSDGWNRLILKNPLDLEKILLSEVKKASGL